ncbi:MAG: flavin oxidoreductase [Rhodobacteraceae bacterium CG17_big_fil_post_rev_8_21_14_2_50_65_11]|nr:MAG: flavin oxidoreductase [Rhodobacteraceae bacterium CG17_big_fil_post_rev_8_21_14_2_50_65_11]
MTPQDSTQHFHPGPEMGRQLRNALGQFGTGVTIVSTMAAGRPVGVTANSFTSVSLDPPLVLWSIARTSRRYPAFAEAEHIAIHVLAKHQMPLCRAFAVAPDAFDAVEWHAGAHDMPLIDGCLARFECERYAEYDGGDHAILVARVLRAAVRPGTPLLFCGGQFGQFAAAG